MTDYFNGFLIGAAQTTVGHPLDTYKVWMQNHEHQKHKITIRNLFRGFLPPFMTNGLLNSVLFGVYSNILKSEITDSHWKAGAISGSMGALVMCPIDVMKIRNQVQATGIMRASLMRGMPLSFAIEVPATAIYFGSYNMLKENEVSPLLSGGLAGLLAWLFIYPIDVVKTRIQSDNTITYREAIYRWKYWNGLSACLLKAFISNAVAFYLYERLNENTLK
jgi:solute carrier family 25 (mitochondrial carnitine/acylcarnitine transporter), member 20/29